MLVVLFSFPPPLFWFVRVPSSIHLSQEQEVNGAHIINFFSSFLFLHGKLLRGGLVMLSISPLSSEIEVWRKKKKKKNG